MTTKRAVPTAPVKHRFALGTLLGLLASAMLLLGFSSVASAAKPIGADGRIHTCYKVKGKAKGSLRVTPAGKKCRKGWRKLAWVATGGAGATGAAGSNGASGTGVNGQGANGSNGTDGANGTDKTAALETRISSLALQVESLEGLLDGVGKGELRGVVGTLDGVTNTELTEALGLAPVVEEVCSQVSGLTGGLDAVNEGVKGLVDLVDTLLPVGGLSPLPSNLLDSYTCDAI